MDATILVPLLIEKLLDLHLDKAPSIINPVFDKKVQAAINNLHSLKRYLRDAEDHEASYGHSSMNDQKIALLLKAVYYADDATDNLIMRRELQKMGFLSSQFLFIQEVKKFKNQFRRLSSCDHHLVMIVKEKAVTSCVEYVAEDNTRVLNYFPNGGSQQQCCMEKETYDVVGFQQQINQLLVQLIPQREISNGQSTELVTKIQDPGQSTHQFKDAAFLGSRAQYGETHRVVLENAGDLVLQMNYSRQSFTKKWDTIGCAWLEMLAYAASRCKANEHAQQLRRGGEFLTHVWLLLAHFGLTDHVRIISAQPRPVARLFAK
ncbi:hypothetical protein Dsin_014530 [Dipteronia sinensis]|uniref:Uncharacterized protein n=1 Tax=Dipteronia sinensis TaxID=43782 RepID=A0AAE0AN34_9ROSI|nr:hypothetical protein Dsin_014530 [Dipteronia sinensis]